MKGFNFSPLGKVQRQQHQEELASQQVKYMHQHLGSSTEALAVFLSHTKTSKHQPNHLGYSQFSHVFFIPSMLWLHMCYSCIIHPKPERFVQVKPWTCPGAQITLEELEFRITEKGFSIVTRTSKSERNNIDCSGCDFFLWFFNHNLCIWFFVQWILVKTQAHL